MSPEARCRAALEASRKARAESPKLGEAWALLQGELVGDAVAVLETLGDRELYLTVMFLERSLVHLELPGIDQLEALMKRRLQKRAVDPFMFVDPAWQEGWRGAVEGVLPSERLGERGRFGGANQLLMASVEGLCKRGALDEARAHADKITAYAKAERGRAFATLGIAHRRLHPSHSAELCATAVRAAAAPPLIQDGGEEAEALAGVLGVFADGDLGAHDQAVRAALKHLLRLGKTRKRKDVRSFGLRNAGVVCAKRALRGLDASWLEHAEALIECIWTDRLRWPCAAWMARAYSALGRSEDAARTLTRIGDAAYGGRDELRGLYPDHIDVLEAMWQSDMKAPATAAAVARAGGDPTPLLESAEAEAKRLYRGRISLYAQLILFDPERAARMLSELAGEERSEAIAASVLTLAHDGRQEDAARALDEALSGGWRPRWVDAYVPYLTHAQVAALERGWLREKKQQKRMTGLSGLAEIHLGQGRWEDACRCIAGAIAGPPREEEPAWVPYYRRGSRANKPPEGGLWLDGVWLRFDRLWGEQADPLEEPVKAALDAARAAPNDGTRLQQLHLLAPRVCSDSKTLKTVRARMRKASPGGRGRDLQTIKKARLVHVDLLLGEIDKAIERAASMRDCRASGWGPSHTAELIGQWFVRHPGEVTISRVHALLRVFWRPHMQDVPVPLLRTVPDLHLALPGGDREAMWSEVNRLRERFRFRGDHAYFEAAAGVAAALAGDAAGSAAYFERALELAKQNSAYVKVGPFLEAILRAHGAAPLSESRSLLQRALDLALGDRPAKVTMTLERAALVLWAAGDQEALLESWREPGRFPSEVRKMLRRSLLIEAPTHAPRPVELVLALFDDSPANEDLAYEQVRSLASALTRIGHAEASSVAALLPGGV